MAEVRRFLDVLRRSALEILKERREDTILLVTEISVCCFILMMLMI